jgi:hypothetical protein
MCSAAAAEDSLHVPYPRLECDYGVNAIGAGSTCRQVSLSSVVSESSSRVRE